MIDFKNNDIDTEFLYTDSLTQKSYPAFMVQAVDELLYKIRHKNIWEICDWAIEFWMKKNPSEAKKYLEAVKEHQKSRKTEFASTGGDGTGRMNVREIVHIPPDISYLLEKIARHKIEDFGRLKFYKEFARRYPGFAGGEKL